MKINVKVKKLEFIKMLKSTYKFLQLYKKSCIGKSIVILIQTNYFGHIVNRLDYYQRIYQCEKSFFIFTTIALDGAVIDYFSSYKSKLYVLDLSFFHKFKSKISFLIYQFCRLYSVIKNFRNVVFNTDLVLRTNLDSNPKIYVYDVANQENLLEYYAPIHQKYTLRSIVNNEIGLSKSSLGDVSAILKNKFGVDYKSRNYAGIKLRNIQYKTRLFHDQRRNAYDLENYLPLIDILLKWNYLVILDCEYPMPISGCNKSVLEINLMDQKYRGLLRTHMLTYSNLMFQQHSGPLHFSNIASVDSIIIDGFPLWQGSWREGDFFVPQEVLYKPSNKRIGLLEIMNEHRDLYMGKYNENIYKFLPSRMDLIESCIIERGNNMPQYYKNAVKLKEAREMFKKYIPNNSLSKYSLSKFPEKLIYEEIGYI
jgi:hypothetical protein